MSNLLAFADAVDIGGGRGRLAAPAAASLARVDRAFRSAFGRAADINEAWRSPEQADKNFRAYVAYRAYLAGLGPWAPWAALAFAAKDSIHCRGYAIDTDDTSTAQMRIWNDHGWFWTVYRNGVLIERWHLEYDARRDNHRNDPAPAGASNTAPPVPKEDDMPESMAATVDGVQSWCWLNWGTGALFAVHSQADADIVGAYQGSVDNDWFARSDGGQLYKNKLALFGILCPQVKVSGSSLTDADLARIKTMLAGTPTAG